MAICGKKRIGLTKKTMKFLGVFFSNDKNLQRENNFRKSVLNIDRILKIWRKTEESNTGGQNYYF